jgi:hypothetical protein
MSAEPAAWRTEVPAAASTGVDWTPVPPSDWFGGAKRCERNFGGETGFLRGPVMQAGELNRVEQMIHRRLVYNAYNLHGSAVAELVEATPLHRYHTVSDALNHGKMLTKTGRILPASDTAEIMSMPVFDVFREAFGAVTLADEDNIGHPQVCMRVARPGKAEDVGFLHRDSWFWEHYNWPVPEGRNRTKVWIGLDVMPEQNGLMLVPGSHRGKFGFAAVNLGNKVKFEADFDPAALPLVTFPGAAGEAVVFNYGTLHIGRLNKAATTRVSIEFTIMYS